MKALLNLRRTIKIAQRQLGWDDELYQQILRDLTGKNSSTKLTFAECNQVLDYCKQQGWNPNPNEGRIKKVQYLWLCLRDAKKLTNPSYPAMEAYCRKFTRKKNWKSASQEEFSNMIESLKSWCRRENVAFKDKP